MIDFTIIIPVYNESQNIQPLVDKINRLELKHNFDILFINDCSTDDTWKVIKSYFNDNILLNHQIESYNYFIKNLISKISKQYNPIKLNYYNNDKSLLYPNQVLHHFSKIS